MRSRIGKVIMGVLLVGLFPAMLLACGAALPSLYQESYYAELPKMVKRLQQTEGKKLIVLGNSDVAFGLDGSLLEQLLSEKGYEYTVCPFGLYGAVGTDAMLSLSEDFIGEGDLVVIVTEPVSETLSCYFGAGAFWKCAEDAPSLLLRVDKEQREALVGNYLSYLQERCAIVRSKNLPAAEGAYTKAAFNEQCDMIYDRPGNIMSLGFDTTEMIDFSSVVVAEDFSARVEEYCKTVAQKGAQVVISFSPMNASAIQDDSDEAVNAYFTQINEAFSCAVISDPRRYIMESGWFYDSNYHLNTDGAVVRTTYLAEDILAFWGCFETVGEVIPAMPESAADLADNSGDTESFLFSEIAKGSGYIVSGLSEKGQKQSTLSVPSYYKGKIVAGFSPDAFSAAKVLEEIHIPATIQGLPDALFSECSQLRRVVLEPRSDLCEVGEKTFDGILDQIRIFVPKEDAAMYRDGAGCEKNSWQSYQKRILTY